MRPHRLSRPLLATLAATVLLVGAAGCGDDEDPEATGSGDTTGETTEPVPDYGGTTGGASGGDAPENAIVAKDFKLSDLTIGPGEDIVLKNEDGLMHTATADDGAFDLRADGGETSDPGAAPDEPGAYDLHCEIHPEMTATLTVEG
jgi:plastocyanin